MQLSISQRLSWNVNDEEKMVTKEMKIENIYYQIWLWN